MVNLINFRVDYSMIVIEYFEHVRFSIFYIIGFYFFLRYGLNRLLPLIYTLDAVNSQYP